MNKLILNPEEHKKRVIGRRSFILNMSKMVALSALGARMYYLQVKEGTKYADLAEGNRVKLVPLMPRRGTIKDRNGKMLADGIPKYQLLYNPPKKVDAVENFIKIADLVNMDPQKKEELLKKVQDPKTSYPLMLDNFLEWNQIASLQVRSRNLKGADVHFIETRDYPFASSTAHITGYTGKISSYSDENKEKFGQLIKNPDLRVGKTGIEKELQNRLLGKPGIVEVEVDSKGRYIKQLEYTSHTRGENLRLSIDVEVQEYLKQLLAGKGGIKTEGASAVIMDVTNGDIIAMSSVPDYDPNKFVRGITNKELQEIYGNIDKPLINKAVSNAYPPGSTFKTVVGIAALEEGLINPNTYAYCKGHVELGDRKFHCWKREGHGPINFMDAISQSCNSYFYELAYSLGIEKIAKYAKAFGLGEDFEIPLPLINDGIVPDRQWKWKNYREAWYDGETLNTGIGQGYLSSTPLQLAVMVSRIATGGRKVLPRLVLENNVPNPKFPFMKEVSGKNVQIMQSAMVGVVNKVKGTAFSSRISFDRYKFAGKTGTSQVTEAKNIKNRKAGFEENHSIFVGYAPIYNPRFAISVVVEYGGSGSGKAARVASDALLFTQEKFNI